jgi:hypothetical protein
MQREYWTERVGLRIAKGGDYEFYSAIRGISEAARNNPTLDARTLKSIASETLDYYDDPSKLPKPLPDSAVGGITSLISIGNPYLGAGTPVFLDVMSSELANQLQGLYPVDRDELRFRYLTEGPQGLRDIWDLAKKDPRIKSVVEDMVNKRFKVKAKIDDTPMSTPDPDLVTYQAAIQSMSNPNIGPEDLAKAFNSFAKAQNKKLEDLTKELKAFKFQAATAQQRQERIANFKQRMDEQRAFFYLAATSVGFINPSLGRTIGGVGDAFSKIAEAQGLYRLRQISSLRLTADVVSAGLLLTSLLNSGGPTADEIILEQLKAISQQIDEFRKEMHARFDHVDQSLSRMYIDLIANFNEVNQNIGRARQGIIGLQVQLLELQGQLGELDRRVQSYAQGLSSQMTSLDQAYCLEAEKYGSELKFDQYVSCALSFASNGAVTAKNAVWTNQATNYLDDAALLGNLDRPIEQNLNFLWGLASARFDHRPGRYVTVANPVVWAANSNAYVRVIARTRPILASVGPTDNLIRAGEEVKASIQSLGQSQTSASGTSRYTLFDRLIPDITYKYEHSQADMVAFERAYQKTVLNGYDAWGDVNQQKDSSTQDTWTYSTAPGATPLDFVPSIRPCSDSEKTFSGNPLSVPTKFASLVPYPYRMAQELGLGQVSACYQNPHWTEYARISGTDAFSGKMTIDVVLSFTPTKTIGKNRKRKKDDPQTKRNGIVGSVQSGDPKTQESFLITHRSATSTNKFTIDCVQKVPEGGGALNTGIARKECVDKRSKGTAADLAEALPSLWDKNLSTTFIPGVSGEQGDPKKVTDDLTTTKKMVEHALEGHRNRLRKEVLDTIRGGAGTSDFIAEERVPVINDFRTIRALKTLLDAYLGLVLPRSLDTDEQLAAALGDLSLNNWAVEISRANGRRETHSCFRTQREFGDACG